MIFDSFSEKVYCTETYPICCTISNFFLLLTFVSYVLSPNLRSPLFGKIIMIFVFCLFLAYASISIVSFGHVELVNQRPPHLNYSPMCRVLGKFMYIRLTIIKISFYKVHHKKHDAKGCISGLDLSFIAFN